MFLLMPIKGGCVTRGIFATSVVIKLVAEYDPRRSISWSTSAGDYFPVEKWRTFIWQGWRPGVPLGLALARWRCALKQGTRTCWHVGLLSKQANCTSSPGVEIASPLGLFPDTWYLPGYLSQQNHAFIYSFLHLVLNKRLGSWVFFLSTGDKSLFLFFFFSFFFLSYQHILLNKWIKCSSKASGDVHTPAKMKLAATLWHII